MDTLGEKLAKVVKKALAKTREHLDESDPEEFKIELDQNVADMMVEANLYHYSYTLIVTGTGESLLVELSVTDEKCVLWRGSNRSTIEE